MRPSLSHDRRFVEYLQQLADRPDRQALAILRRGLIGHAAGAIETYRYLAPWLPEGAGPSDEEPYLMIANLFAWHPLSWREDATERVGASNLGASFALLAEEHHGQTRRESPSIEARFTALLTCHRDDLWTHLRHAVGLLKSRDVPVDWLRLLQDVRRWDRETQEVQRSWARAFWRERVSSLGATGDEAESAASPAEWRAP